MRCSETIDMAVSKLQPLANNPRKITKADFGRLVDSIKINGFWRHRPEAVELDEATGKYTTLCGNQRLKAARKLKLKTIPCVIYSELSEEERVDLIARDNINNGDWDVDILKEDDMYKGVDFQFMGLDIPGIGDDDEDGSSQNGEGEGKDDGGRGSDEAAKDDDKGSDESSSFLDKMEGDVLYPSDNEYEIPTLRLDMQAGHLELPFTPWGANSRLRKGVATYHFYVDDYRFTQLFRNPVNLISSGCKAIVEPNLSCHDQTPLAFGLSLIYKKRWLARYCQELGIKVYADLNVAEKFREVNALGIPKGYNAFMTRGTDGWLTSLQSDLEMAQRISGLEQPNLLVYGGGSEVKAFCQEHNLLYISDFINARKK